MVESFLSRNSGAWVYFQAFAEEIYEIFVVCLDPALYVCQFRQVNPGKTCLSFLFLFFISDFFCNLLEKNKLFCEILLHLCSSLKHPRWPRTSQPLYFSQYSYFIIAFKKHLTRKQLSNDASQTPNINFFSIRTSQYNFRSSVTSGLNIVLKIIVKEHRRPNIDDFNK